MEAVELTRHLELGKLWVVLLHALEETDGQCGALQQVVARARAVRQGGSPDAVCMMWGEKNEKKNENL